VDEFQQQFESTGCPCSLSARWRHYRMLRLKIQSNLGFSPQVCQNKLIQVELVWQGSVHRESTLVHQI